MSTREIEVRDGDPTDASSIELVRAMEAEVEQLYSDRWGSIHSVAISPEQMSAPDGAFLLLLENGREVGCGAIKRLDGATCELKRMYLRPEVRGSGLSSMLLEALETRARRIGYSKARLDTGDRQPAARRLYERAGYEPIPRYNENNQATLWYEKAL